MNKLDFPPSPVNGQIYSQNGLSYQYDGTVGVWLTTVVSPLPTPSMSNNQVMFVDGAYPNGSNGLTFSKTANTTYANTIVVTGNVTASFVKGDGSQLTNVLTPANNYANTVGTAGNNYTNFVGASINSYWSTSGSFANTSGASYNGNLNVPSGNLSIRTADGPATLYVNGSAAATINTLVDGATVTPIFASNNNFTVTLAGNRAIANPTGPIPGQSGVISIVQDSTGGRTLTWGDTWRFQGNIAPTLSTSGGAVDMLVYYVRTTSNISVQLINNIG